MGSTLETVVFYFLAAFIIAMSIMTVTTQRIVRSATYLLFVLFGTAGIYFLLGYTFLGSVQIMVYAGGIVVLYVFSILLTSGPRRKTETKQVSGRTLYDGCRFSDYLVYHPEA
jgi:NADH-quinone oxidoreductase subunit J